MSDVSTELTWESHKDRLHSPSVACEGQSLCSGYEKRILNHFFTNMIPVISLGLFLSNDSRACQGGVD